MDIKGVYAYFYFLKYNKFYILFSPCIINPLLCLMPEMQFCYTVALHTLRMCKPQTSSRDQLEGTDTCCQAAHDCLPRAMEPFPYTCSGHTETLRVSWTLPLLLNNRFSFQYLWCLCKQSVRPLGPQGEIRTSANGEETLLAH